MHPETIYVTEADLKKLRALVDAGSARDSETLDLLDSELGRATVVPSEKIPSDVVTMNSRVVVEDAQGKRRELTLVYPKEANPSEGKVSVLAPVGAALLGLSVGQSIDWPLPGGRATRLQIVSVLYQPEASGDLHR